MAKEMLEYIRSMIRAEVRKALRTELGLGSRKMEAEEESAEDDETEDDDMDDEGGKTKNDGRAHRDMTCIAPNCGRKSKGPRFRYLCEKHVDAPLSKVKVWQAKRREEKAAER